MSENTANYDDAWKEAVSEYFQLRSCTSLDKNQNLVHLTTVLVPLIDSIEKGTKYVAKVK